VVQQHNAQQYRRIISQQPKFFTQFHAAYLAKWN
jgi:hypothetical protein